MTIILNKTKNTLAGEKNFILDANLPEINNVGFIKEGGVKLRLSKNNFGLELELTPDECRMLRDVLTSFLKKYDNELMILFRQGRTFQTRTNENTNEDYDNKMQFNNDIIVPTVRREEVITPIVRDAKPKNDFDFDIPGMNLVEKEKKNENTNNEVKYY